MLGRNNEIRGSQRKRMMLSDDVYRRNSIHKSHSGKD
jgi:hypothetical protein